MHKKPHALFIALMLAASPAFAQSADERIEQLQTQIDNLNSAVSELSATSSAPSVTIGGYGELKYSNTQTGDADERDVTLDFHRFVLFFGHEFSDTIRFNSEVEIEHTVAGDDARGEVEIETAYVEFDLDPSTHLRSGILLMPVGVINETHEPPTFYGVNRPVVETTVIPTTWWSGGVGLNQQLSSGISYDVLITEGLETEDPSVVPDADPFNIKSGKQKTSFADAHDLAITARVKYTGLPGHEFAVYAQYQPDLDQSAATSYADAALFVGGHVIVHFGDFKATALYARWDLDGEAADLADQNSQYGGYGELSYKPLDEVGVFVRASQWALSDAQEAQQLDAGVNYWPHEDVVFKFDVQNQNEDAGEVNGFHLGMGYQF